MVVLASDTITAPLLPRNIHFHTLRKITTSTTNNSRNNAANSWSTKTKIIFAVVVVVVVLLVLALALFLAWRRKRLARGANRSSMETIAENQGYGAFNPGIVRQLTDQMDGKSAAAGYGDEGGQQPHERFSVQSGPGMYGGGGLRGNPHGVGAGAGGAGVGPAIAEEDEKFENVPLEGGAPPAKPGQIYRFNQPTGPSRFSP